MSHNEQNCMQLGGGLAAQGYGQGYYQPDPPMKLNDDERALWREVMFCVLHKTADIAQAIDAAKQAVTALRKI